jgi:hypothetical protein
MKILTITCESTDNDDEFQTELDIIVKQLFEGYESGFDINETNSYSFSIEYKE